MKDNKVQDAIDAIQSGIPLAPSNGAPMRLEDLEVCDYDDLTHLIISKATIDLVLQVMTKFKPSTPPTIRSAITPESLFTFTIYARDAVNWAGVPWVSTGNISCDKQMRGNLADLVKKELIVINEDEMMREKYIVFSIKGLKLAEELGIDSLLRLSMYRII